MRTVIYARYSSDLQNSRSIEDQIAVCRQRAQAEGWPVVATFTDAAISGAAGLDSRQRPGLNAMLAALESGGIDQVLAESTSRIARDEGDGYEVRRKLKFHGVRLFTLSDGEVDEFRGTIRALIDAQQRKDTAANVRRGQRGTVADGRIAAGLAYGYRVANEILPDGSLRRGLRMIDEDKAEIVRRIFREVAGGRSAREVAFGLNVEGIAGPRGGQWTTSSILGDRKRGNGLLKNALYAGRIIHNRTHKVAHPETRRTLIRINDAAARQEQAVEHLRIVDEATWQRVQDVLAARAHGPINAQRRPRRLLSGLMRCGLCGNGLIVVDRAEWGCAAHRNGKGCTNNRRISNERAEATVLADLQRELVAPEVVDAYVAEYAATRARRAGEIERERARLAAAHEEAKRKVERILIAIGQGADEFEEVRDMMRRARADRDTLAEQLAAIERNAPVALHPLIARNYRDQIAALAQALTEPTNRTEAIPQIRALIGSIVASPATDGKRGLDIRTEGHLANILNLAASGDFSQGPENSAERRQHATRAKS